jgi:hypothetical protein
VKHESREGSEQEEVSVEAEERARARVRDIERAYTTSLSSFIVL